MTPLVKSPPKWERSSPTPRSTEREGVSLYGSRKKNGGSISTRVIWSLTGSSLPSSFTPDIPKSRGLVLRQLFSLATVEDPGEAVFGMIVSVRRQK